MGQKILFCENLCIGDEKLKEKFRRLFALSMQKIVLIIAECGFWDGALWVWNFHRDVPWELNLLDELNKIICHVTLNIDIIDKVF